MSTAWQKYKAPIETIAAIGIAAATGGAAASLFADSIGTAAGGAMVGAATAGALNGMVARPGGGGGGVSNLGAAAGGALLGGWAAGSGQPAPAADPATVQAMMTAMPGLTAASANALAASGVAPSDLSAAAANGATADTFNTAASSLSTTGSASGVSTALQAAGIVLPAVLANYAVNTVKNAQVNPSQYVVDPTTGQVISSSVVGPGGTTTNLGAATSNLNTAATTGLANVSAEQQALYNQAGANQGGYVQSVIAPVQAQAGQSLAQQKESQALRGLSGSSLADQSLSNTGLAGSEAVSNATAQALQSSLTLQGNIASGQSATAVNQSGLGTTIANQNLAAMKMGTVPAASQQASNTAVSNAQGSALSGLSGALTSAAGTAATNAIVSGGVQWVKDAATGLWKSATGLLSSTQPPPDLNAASTFASSYGNSGTFSVGGNTYGTTSGLGGSTTGGLSGTTYATNT